MMHLLFRILTIALIAIFFIALNATHARAQTHFLSQTPVIQTTGSSASAPSNKAQKPKKEKKAKAKNGGGVSFYEGSGETRAERDKRLMRECKGRPNAGLCEGYARP
jgi:Mor family transcriptional regulator